MADSDPHIPSPPINHAKPGWKRPWVILAATVLLTAVVGSFTNEIVSRLLNSDDDRSKPTVTQNDAIAAQPEKDRQTKVAEQKAADKTVKEKPDPPTTQTDAARAAAEYNKGVVFLNREDWDTAIVCFTEAIRIKPDFADAYFRRGAAYDTKGEYDKAIADFSEVIRLNPDDVDAYLKRGFAYARKKEYDEAIADYSEVIRLRPDDAKAYFDRGDVYAIRREYDKAIVDFSEVIRLRPEYRMGYVARGITYGRKGDRAKADADFAKAKELGVDP